MDESTFWHLVDAAKAQAGEDLEARIDALADALEELSTGELQAFQTHYTNAINQACRWDLWGAAYVMNGGCSDDGFHYFREWLISEGREVFEAALDDPESLAAVADHESYELEGLGYVALNMLDNREDADPTWDEPVFQGEPEGEPWEEDDLADMFPKLAARFDA